MACAFAVEKRGTSWCSVDSNSFEVDLARHRRLGSGAFGAVFLATHAGVQVAAKTQYPFQHAEVYGLDDEVALVEILRTVNQEISHLARLAELNHPHLIKFIGVAWQQHPSLDVRLPVWILSELCDGGTLENRIRNAPGRLPPSQVADWMSQCAQGLQAIHEVGLTHRDIKPQNLLFRANRLVIADFGLARIFHALGQRSSSIALASAGGTPVYTGPGEGTSAEPSRDIYALGVVAVVALLCEDPHEEHEQRIHQAENSAVYARQAGRREFAELVREAVINTPQQRPNATQVVRRLHTETSRHVAFHNEQLRLAGSAIAAIRESFHLPSLIERLRDFGFTVQQLRESGFTPLQLWEAGYTVRQLQEAGFTGQRLREAGFTVPQLREAGSTLEQLVEAGYTARQLREDGATVRQLFAAGIALQQLVEVGFTGQQLREVGFTCQQLLEVGFTWQQLREAGFSCQQLREAGSSLWQLLQLGFTLQDTGLPPQMLHTTGRTARELREAGVTAAELRAVGYTAPQLQEAGFTLQQLLRAGYTSWRLQSLGWTARQLRDAGVTAQEMWDQLGQDSGLAYVRICI